MTQIRAFFDFFRLEVKNAIQQRIDPTIPIGLTPAVTEKNMVIGKQTVPTSVT